ncbi:unnamed protein product [Camellia sinensis]
MSTQEETQPENRKNKGKSSQVPSVKAHWDAKSNEIFIKICVEQVKVGHRPGTHLDKVRWENVITKFKSMTGKAYQLIQMKNHWDVLKKDWLLWNNLLRGKTGFGHDPLTGAISAYDEWWTLKLEVRELLNVHILFVFSLNTPNFVTCNCYFFLYNCCRGILMLLNSSVCRCNSLKT